MPTVRRTKLADSDLRQIWKYIAADSHAAADRLLQKIDSKLDLYARNPLMGTRRDSLEGGLRSFPVGKYLVFYQTAADGIEVVRILHGARDIGPDSFGNAG